MATTTFVDDTGLGQDGTTIVAAWLNDVDLLTYEIFTTLSTTVPVVTGEWTFSTADDASSGTTGAINTAGGIGITKALWVGTTGTFAGVVSVDDVTDTSSGTTGSIHTDGGLGVAKNLFVATNATVTGTSTLTGVTTPTGGLAPAGGTTIVLARPGCVHTGGIPATATAEGINATPVITEIYYSELFVPCNMSVTGISFFKGGTVGTDSTHSALLDADGALVTGTATGAL